MSPLSSFQSFQRLKRRALQHVWVVRILLLAAVVATLYLVALLLAQPLQSLAARIWYGPSMVSTFLSDPLYTLPSYEGRTNLLFLGMGGGEHDGGDLTDTMIYVALDLKNTSVTLLSLPRDIWVASIEAKLNAAYAFGEVEATGSGYTLVEDAVYEITDQPIHYVVGLDFEGFVEVIDALGGLRVKVDQTFVDTQYPIKGKETDLCDGDPLVACRYETVQFDRGLQQMDGQTALKFSRSRHADGEEGTDFARALRQQKIIDALKQKLTSSEIFLSPSKLWELKKLADRYVIVDPPLSDTEYAAFAGFGYSFWRSGKEVKTMTLDMGNEEVPGFLVNPPLEKYDQWVLEPRGGNWEEFQAYFKQVLREEN